MDETIDKATAATALFGGHWFDMSTARRNLLHLGAILAGCETLIREVACEGRNIPGWSKRDHPIEMLFDDHCTAEISRLLVETAVTIRMLDDMAGGHVVDISFAVGEFEEGSVRSELTLREACNKIIHARKVAFDLGGGTTKYVNSDGQEVNECIVYVKPTSVELRGAKSGEEWIAELQIYPFIKAATMVTYRYEEALDELHEHADLRAKAS